MHGHIKLGYDSDSCPDEIAQDKNCSYRTSTKPNLSNEIEYAATHVKECLVGTMIPEIAGSLHLHSQFHCHFRACIFVCQAGWGILSPHKLGWCSEDVVLSRQIFLHFLTTLLIARIARTTDSLTDQIAQTRESKTQTNFIIDLYQISDEYSCTYLKYCVPLFLFFVKRK